MAVDAAAAEAAAMAISAPPSPPPASLTAPFPPAVPPRRRGGQAGKGGARGKRTASKTPTAKSAGPPSKKKKTAAAAATATSSDKEASAAAALSPEAAAVWKLVGGQVEKVVHVQNKALWLALKDSVEQIDNLRADAVRLEARVDAQGQGNERTALAVGALRVAVNRGAHVGSSCGSGGSGDGGVGAGGNGGLVAGGSGGLVAGGTATGSGSGSSDGRVKDVKPHVKYQVAKDAAMARAPENEDKASQFRRPIRAAVKKRMANATSSRDVLMDAGTTTAVIGAEVVKALGVPADVAHSYLMNPVFFPSSADGGQPTKKRPMAVITSTIPHTIAQIREFVLKPYFHVLGFPHSPMPARKAKKYSKNDYFISSYKGEKAMVAAAKNVFTKIGGGSRIVKDRAAGSRYHVEMVVGHHALFASFVRNEFEVALGLRNRRRGGNGNGTYCHWVDEFAASIKHLSKNHQNKKIHAGYRIVDAIDPDIVMRTSGGTWAFSSPEDDPTHLPAAAITPASTRTTAARPPRSAKSGAVASARDTNDTRAPATDGVEMGALRNCADDVIEVGGTGRASDGGGQLPPPPCPVITDDNDSDPRTAAGVMGLNEGGGGGNGGGGAGGGRSDLGGGDGDESDETGGGTSSSDADDSDSGEDSSSDGGSDTGAVVRDDDDEEEGP